MAKKEKPFNNPFGVVKLPDKPKPPAPARVEPKPVAAPRHNAALSEDELWSMAVDGADPLEDRSHRVRPSPQPLSLPPQHLDPDLTAYDELRALVTGEVPFDISDTDEYIEGHAHGLDVGIVRKLKRGDFAVQAHLDLHGLLKEEAKAELEAFVVKARQSSKRCILVVTGRGLHSKDNVPVLKDAMKRWMATGRFSRHVLAFCSARQHDGGAGAVYLLLRRT